MKFPKRLFLRIVKSLAILTGLLLAGAILFVAWLHWAGARDWKRVQAELVARGEKLTLTELVPPAPPDVENFFADPLWQEVRDKAVGKDVPPQENWTINQWKTPLSPEELEQIKALNPAVSSADAKDRNRTIRSLHRKLKESTDPAASRQIAALLLDLLKPATPLLARIDELSLRPGASFPIRYEKGFSAPLPHITPILVSGQSLSTRSLAELALEEPEKAAADVHTMLRLSSVNRNEPLLISLLIREALLSLALAPIDSGLEHHQWSSADLAAFQSRLEGIRLQPNLCHTFRGERACFNAVSPETLKELVNFPFFAESYFGYQKPWYNTLLQRCLDAMEKNPATGEMDGLAAFNRETAAMTSHKIDKALHSLSLSAIPAFEGTIQKTLETQIQLDQTLTACALERYRLDHGSYPPTLDALLPACLTVIPTEPTTGTPLHYRPTDDGAFLLWTPNWKLESLDGKPGEFKGEGDIVWNKPLSRKTREPARE